MVSGEGGRVDEVNAPFLLDVRATAGLVVGIGVGVAADPEADRPGVLGQVALEGARVGLAVDEVKVRSPLRRSLGEVAVNARPPPAVKRTSERATSRIVMGSPSTSIGASDASP